MKQSELAIQSVTPAIGVPAGEVSIQCRGFRPGHPSTAKVLVGDAEASIVTASSERVVVRLPESTRALGIALKVGDVQSPVFPFLLGVRLASDLHPVANPAIAADGSVITTMSGMRGQASQHSLFRITRKGEIVPFPCEIMNPTGLLFGPDGQLYISSRSDGTVLRYKDFDQLEVVADDLGVPCGLAFDSQGRLYVGDRTGRIHCLDLDGSRREFATLPQSVSAFHLAMDAEDTLYVTGPTLAMRDPVYCISRSGEISILVDGFARPQGLALGREGDLWLAAAFGGRKGIFRYSRSTKRLVHAIAGPMLVGLAWNSEDIILVDGGSVYAVQMSGPSGKLS